LSSSRVGERGGLKGGELGTHAATCTLSTVGALAAVVVVVNEAAEVLTEAVAAASGVGLLLLDFFLPSLVERFFSLLVAVALRGGDEDGDRFFFLEEVDLAFLIFGCGT
jgi:hypothetical protein